MRDQGCGSSPGRRRKLQEVGCSKVHFTIRSSPQVPAVDGRPRLSAARMLARRAHHSRVRSAEASRVATKG
eukprot:8344988-Alexandrium_andersonii.AAC.1